MNEKTVTFKTTEDRTMTEHKLSGLNETELSLVCGGVPINLDSRVLIFQPPYTNAEPGTTTDAGSMDVNSDDDPRMPTRL
jgi:hypothetical protein